MNSEELAAAKRRAGESAIEAVSDGDVVGLGSGSTAAAAIRALGRRVDAGLDVRGVPTSYQARGIAIEAGVPVIGLDEAMPDIAIDGADEVAVPGDDGAEPSDAGETAAPDHTAAATGPSPDPGVRALIKGGGAAHARERVVAAAAARLLIVVDATKPVTTLSRAVPLAVLPDAVPVVEREIEALGGAPTLRAAERKSGPVVTDDGHLVIDADFGAIADPVGLAARLDGLPGLVAHGLFVDLADAVHVGGPAGVTVV